MFPNTRLMVVAILAAIAGIGCGLGLFATFRVNHEPLTRFAEGSPPLQLAFDNLALGSDARMPLEARLPVGTVGKVISVPVIVPTATPALEQAGADAALDAGSGVQQPPPPEAPADQSKTASLTAAAEPAEPSSAVPETSAPPPSQQEGVMVEDERPADSAAAMLSAVPTSAITSASDDQQPAPKATKPQQKAAKPAKASHPLAQARRPAKIVRVRRTVTTAVAQPTYQYSQPTYSQSAYSQSTYTQPTYTQPTYTWADGTAQAAQTVKRVVIKRHRPVKNSAPAAQSNPSAATADLNNFQ